MADYVVQNHIFFKESFLLSQNHLAHCQFATVHCPHCQQSVKKTLLEEHMTAECRRRPVSCPDCIETFVYEEREVVLALELGNPSACIRCKQIFSQNVFCLLVAP